MVYGIRVINFLFVWKKSGEAKIAKRVKPTWYKYISHNQTIDIRQINWININSDD